MKYFLTTKFEGQIFSEQISSGLLLQRWPLKEELIADVKGRKFSLIVDETTDVSTTKQLCVLIRYYSQAKETILTAFVDLVSLVHGCADDIFNAIKECITGIDLKLEDCVGYGSDGALVMVGEHDSVWTRILAVAPNCIKMTCICHSLALCVYTQGQRMANACSM